VFWGEWARRNPDAWDKEMQMLFRFYAEGRIRPLSAEPYAFEQAPAALACMRERSALGKLVVTVCPEVA
jgi:NADPH2:quinone reductase